MYFDVIKKTVFSFEIPGPTRASLPILPTLIDTSSRDCGIDVRYTTKRNKNCLKNTELLYIQKEVSYVLSIVHLKKIYTFIKQKRICFSNFLILFLFHRMAGSCRKNCTFCNYHTHKKLKICLKNANQSIKHSKEVHLRVKYIDL